MPELVSVNATSTGKDFKIAQDSLQQTFERDQLLSEYIQEEMESTENNMKYQSPNKRHRTIKTAVNSGSTSHNQSMVKRKESVNEQN